LTITLEEILTGTIKQVMLTKQASESSDSVKVSRLFSRDSWIYDAFFLWAQKNPTETHSCYVKIPKGIHYGTVIILRESGDYIIDHPTSNAAATHLRSDVRLHIVPPTTEQQALLTRNRQGHFMRASNHVDLILQKSIPFSDACSYCAEINVPTLGGFPRLVALGERLILPGFEFRIRGQGLPYFGEQFKRGDLVVRLDVELPHKTSREERTALARFLDSK